MLSNENITAQNYDREKSYKGRITGNIIDEETSSSLESTSLRIFNTIDSSFVIGTGTDSKGEFNFKVPFGNYLMTVSYINYKTVSYHGIIIDDRNPVYNTGTIKLKPDTTTTKEIEITAEKDMMEIAVDKKIFNKEKA